MSGAAAVSTALLRSQVLSDLSGLARHFSTQPLHPSMAVAPLLLINAIRVSHGTRQVSASYHSSLTLIGSTALMLLLLFGAVVVIYALLALPSPILVAKDTVLVFSAVHVLLTASGIGSALIKVQDTQLGGLVLDLLFAGVDSVCRTEGIVLLGINAVRSHPSEVIASSPFAAIFIGTLTGGLTPLLISLLHLTSSNWTLRYPSFLASPSELLAVDVVSSWLISALYLSLTIPGGFYSVLPSFPALNSLSAHLTASVPFGLAAQALSLERLSKGKPLRANVGASELFYVEPGSTERLMGHEEAYALCAIVLFACLAGARLLRLVTPGNAEVRPPKPPPKGKPLASKKAKASPAVIDEKSSVAEGNGASLATLAKSTALEVNGNRANGVEAKKRKGKGK